MKYILLVACALATMSFAPWNTSFEKAKQEATQEHRLILLSFSGSDWCGPCIRLHKEFFDSEAFHGVENKLVLVNADFPRQKKNQLPKEVQQENNKLAEKYNTNGAFPYTLLLDETGKVIKTWDGIPKEKPTEFVAEIKDAIGEGK